MSLTSPFSSFLLLAPTTPPLLVAITRDKGKARPFATALVAVDTDLPIPWVCHLRSQWTSSYGWFFHGWSTYPPLNVPPRKKGFNKALLRETNGLYALNKALFWGRYVRAGGKLTSHNSWHNRSAKNGKTSPWIRKSPQVKWSNGDVFSIALLNHETKFQERENYMT